MAKRLPRPSVFTVISLIAITSVIIYGNYQTFKAHRDTEREISRRLPTTLNLSDALKNRQFADNRERSYKNILILDTVLNKYGYFGWHSKVYVGIPTPGKEGYSIGDPLPQIVFLFTHNENIIKFLKAGHMVHAATGQLTYCYAVPTFSTHLLRLNAVEYVDSFTYSLSPDSFLRQFDRNDWQIDANYILDDCT